MVAKLCVSFSLKNGPLSFFTGAINSDFHSYSLSSKYPSLIIRRNQPVFYLGQILLVQNTACSVSKKNKKPITIS